MHRGIHQCWQNRVVDHTVAECLLFKREMTCVRTFSWLMIGWYILRFLEFFLLHLLFFLLPLECYYVIFEGMLTFGMCWHAFFWTQKIDTESPSTSWAAGKLYSAKKENLKRVLSVWGKNSYIIGFSKSKNVKHGCFFLLLLTTTQMRRNNFIK